MLKGSDWEALLSKEIFLPKTILGCVEYSSFRVYRCDGRRGIYAVGGYIFELKCDNINLGSEPFHSLYVVIGGNQFVVGYLTGGWIRLGREYVNTITHAAGSNSDHSAKLSTT